MLIRETWIVSMIAFFFTALMVQWFAPLTGGEDVDRIGTVIYGRVTDNSTDEPVKDVVIEIINGKEGDTFGAFTDENGEYSLQVGKGGTFYVHFSNRSFWPEAVIVNMTSYEDKRVDAVLVRPEHDLYIQVHSYRERTFFEGASVTLKDLNNTDRIIEGTSGRDGWLNITVGAGNYSIDGSWGVFKDHQDLVRIEAGSYKQINLELWPPRARIDSPNIFTKKVVNIPPKSMYIYSIGSDEMYFFHTEYKATTPVAMYGIPGYFFDNFWNWTMNCSGSAEEEPWPCYDVGIGPARGGGSSMDTWMVPYRIVFVNEGNVTSTVSFTVRYEYGLFYEMPEGYVLFDKGGDEGEKGASDLLVLFPILFIVILASIVVGIVLLAIQGKDRSEPPKRSVTIRARSCPTHRREQVRSQPLYRGGSIKKRGSKNTDYFL